MHTEDSGAWALRQWGTKREYAHQQVRLQAAEPAEENRKPRNILCSALRTSCRGKRQSRLKQWKQPWVVLEIHSRRMAKGHRPIFGEVRPMQYSLSPPCQTRMHLAQAASDSRPQATQEAEARVTIGYGIVEAWVVGLLSAIHVRCPWGRAAQRGQGEMCVYM